MPRRQSPLKQLAGRRSVRRPTRKLQEQMERSIEQRCETIRGTHWPPTGRQAVWNSHRANHLGQRSTQSHPQAGHMDASDPTHSKSSCATGAVHIWVPGLGGASAGRPPIQLGISAIGLLPVLAHPTIRLAMAKRKYEAELHHFSSKPAPPVGVRPGARRFRTAHAGPPFATAVTAGMANSGCG
jgi:hypothetical protein